MAGFFTIEAEYLHLYRGRRAAVDIGGGKVPFTIGAVRYEPETALILVEAITPIAQITELAFTADAIVDVEPLGVSA